MHIHTYCTKLKQLTLLRVSTRTLESLSIVLTHFSTERDWIVFTLHTLKLTHTHTHTHRHTHTHTHRHTHTEWNSHWYTHSHTHGHTHTRTHLFINALRTFGKICGLTSNRMHDTHYVAVGLTVSLSSSVFSSPSFSFFLPIHLPGKVNSHQSATCCCLNINCNFYFNFYLHFNVHVYSVWIYSHSVNTLKCKYRKLFSSLFSLFSSSNIPAVPRECISITYWCLAHCNARCCMKCVAWNNYVSAACSTFFTASHQVFFHRWSALCEDERNKTRKDDKKHLLSLSPGGGGRFFLHLARI